MIVRQLKPSDAPRLQELYLQQGHGYAEPEWSTMIGQVLEDDHGILRAYELGRKTIETYAGMDMSAWATPGIKAEHFIRLDAKAIEEFRSQGYEDQSAWIPPVCRAFIRRMMNELYWVKAEGYVPLVRWFGRQS